MFQFKSCVGNFSLRIFHNTKLVTFSQILSHSIIDSASIRNCNFFMHLLKASSLKANCHFITTGKIGFTCHFVNNGDWIHWSNCDQMERKYINTIFQEKKAFCMNVFCFFPIISVQRSHLWKYWNYVIGICFTALLFPQLCNKKKREYSNYRPGQPNWEHAMW